MYQSDWMSGEDAIKHISQAIGGDRVAAFHQLRVWVKDNPEFGRARGHDAQRKWLDDKGLTGVEGYTPDNDWFFSYFCAQIEPEHLNSFIAQFQGASEFRREAVEEQWCRQREDGAGALPTHPRGRGRRPEKRYSIVAKMRSEIREGKLTQEALGAMKEEELHCRYQASRDTCRKARDLILSQIVGVSDTSNSDN